MDTSDFITGARSLGTTATRRTATERAH
ncbi:hypothetical protein LB504_007827, partial [Fusarium proliferatum]